MKKLLAALITMCLLAGLAACSDTQQTDSAKELDINEIVNDDGVRFTPSLSSTGTTEDMPLDSDKIIICGDTYTLPIKLSDLTDNGWELVSDNFENDFAGETRTLLTGFKMKNDSYGEISLLEVYNDASYNRPIEHCLITGISLHYYTENTLDDPDYYDSFSNKATFVFPGGITYKSTASDVLGIYGNPYNEKYFYGGDNTEDRIVYTHHRESSLSFSYSFRPDGTLSYAYVQLEID
ncbi:MAG: hypothetical protein II998_08840 [Clostridia bacterium]|nr:hypothetical protein [Clostridia bacterium]